MPAFPNPQTLAGRSCWNMVSYGVWGGLRSCAAASSPRNLLVKVTLHLKIAAEWSWWAWPVEGVGRRHGLWMGLSGPLGTEGSFLGSPLAWPGWPGLSPSGDLGASGYPLPLLSSSSVTVGSGLWSAELEIHNYGITRTSRRVCVHLDPPDLDESVFAHVHTRACNVVDSWQYMYVTADVFMWEHRISACGSFLYFKLIESN